MSVDLTPKHIDGRNFSAFVTEFRDFVRVKTSETEKTPYFHKPIYKGTDKGYNLAGKIKENAVFLQANSIALHHILY